MIKLGTKAQTLEIIKNYFEVPDFTKFYVREWIKDKKPIIQKIKNFSGKIIIRSSSLGEDKKNLSNAGKYISEILKKKTDTEITKLVNKIILDYKKKDKFFLKNEIIIQKYVSSISMSGVVFTHDISNSAPYYVINYNDVSKLSSSVTSGKGLHANKKIYILRDDINKLKSLRFKNLLETIIKIEKLFNNNFLDIEFILKKNFNVVILQVRSISNNLINENFDKKNQLRKKINSEKRKFIPLIKNNILGQMPDWNPAEIIGENPERLSFSLYKKIVTDRYWFIARKEMGYSNFKGSKVLMHSILGKPYIDLNKSFNSFFPNDLPKALRIKLINIWKKKLKKNLSLHDKIEFEVAITCYDFALEGRLKHEDYSSLTHNEKKKIINCYKKFTFELISKINFSKYLNKLNILKKNKLTCKFDFKKQLLIISRNGIIPFAILARHAFIGQSILESLVKKKIISKNQKENFQLSYKTITKAFLNDMTKVVKNKLSRKEFMLKYGHLRPGTYDIKSPRYDKMKNFQIISTNIKQYKYKFNHNVISKLNILINKKNILNINSEEVINYIKKSCELREYSKFIFTMQLSYLIENIKEFLSKKNISLKDMAHLSINDLNKSKNIILKKIKKNKIDYKINSRIKLPQVLYEINNFSVIPYQINEPNFVTKKTIIKDLVILNKNKKNLKNKILIIENADPGYDWIFSKNISGLITKFGGANSHMTIRCAELNLPAMIGCGPKIYNEIINSKRIELNCKSKTYNIIL